MENPIEINDFWGTPIFGNTHIPIGFCRLFFRELHDIFVLQGVETFYFQVALWCFFRLSTNFVELTTKIRQRQFTYMISLPGSSAESPAVSQFIKVWVTIPLMEEILHHLTFLTPCNNGAFTISTVAGFLPSTVSKVYRYYQVLLGCDSQWVIWFPDQSDVRTCAIWSSKSSGLVMIQVKRSCTANIPLLWANLWTKPFFLPYQNCLSPCWRQSLLRPIYPIMCWVWKHWSTILNPIPFIFCHVLAGLMNVVL